MFTYDSQILAVAGQMPKSVNDVLAALQSINGICIDADGLKWFNWLYWQVTRAVEARIQAGGLKNPAWLERLDVEFAKLYFAALRSSLNNQPTPECWQILLSDRRNTQLARIQFALAGINAHINHDLPMAILATGIKPSHGSPEYQDYSELNQTLDSTIEAAKKQLHIRLVGGELPTVSHLEDVIAAFGVSAARESAWQNAEHLDQLRAIPALQSSFESVLDGFSTVIGKGLLIPV